jgi:hypothetical protein
MPRSCANKTAYNATVYEQTLVRFRRHSDLAEAVAMYKAEGHSLNLLINHLLAGFFRQPLAHRVRTMREVLYSADDSPEVRAEREMLYGRDAPGGG